jgi:WD40 repeat protein
MDSFGPRETGGPGGSIDLEPGCGGEGKIRSVDSGERIGPYTVLRELGRGGQAVVYLAEDKRLGRPVALKVLTHTLDGEGKQLLRFRRESEVTARLDHPGICTVFEAGELGRIAWIAMRYVEGETLARLIESRASRPPSAVQIGALASLFETVARTLHTAHEAGLVHRDIKPGNVMVTPSGDPVLMDFGLAREATGSSSETVTGTVLGTPAYVAPEVIEGRAGTVDRRTDVYSLGVSMYEALTGKLPFEAPTRHELHHRILGSEADDPRRSNPALSEDFAVVVATAMAKEPDRRYQTALDLAEDLRRMRVHEPIRARPAGPLLRLALWSRRNPGLAASLGGLLLALGGGLGTSLHLLGKTKDALEFATGESQARQRALQASREAERETASALSEKDRALQRAIALDLVGASAIAESDDPMRALLLARLAVRRLACPETLHRLHEAIRRSPERPAPFEDEGSFGTGGAVIEAAAGNVVRVVPGPGRPAVELRGHEAPVIAVAASADGSRILTGSKDGTARLWDATGRALLVLGGHTTSVDHVALSPEGDRAVSRAEGGTVRRWDLVHREIAVARVDGAPVQALSFSRDGRLLHALARSGRRRTFDLDGRLVGDLEATGHVAAWSSSGDRILVEEDSGGLVVAGPGPGRIMATGIPAAGRRSIEFSADGEAVGVLGDDGAVHLWRRAGGPIRALRDPESGIRWFAVGPGGSVATISADRKLRLWPADGAPPILLGDREFNADILTFSQDGNLLVTGGRQDTTFRVWDLAKRPPGCTWVQESLMRPLNFSPRGDHIAGQAAGAVSRIWDRTGAEVATLRGVGWSRVGPVFSPDGRRVATGCSDYTVRLFDLLGREEGVLDGADGQICVLDFSPDGRFVAGGTYGGSVRVWAATPEALLDLAAARSTRALTSWERERYAELLPEEESLELVAQRIAEEALRRAAVVADARERVASDGTLDPVVREAALARLKDVRDNPSTLNDDAWVAIISAGSRPETYARAMRRAEIATALVPENSSFQNTLGIAAFRCGRYAEAVKALTFSDGVHSKGGRGPEVADIAFLAMALHRLGRGEEARSHLERLREAMRRPPEALNYYDPWFADEAEREFGVKIGRGPAK